MVSPTGGRNQGILPLFSVAVASSEAPGHLHSLPSVLTTHSDGLLRVSKAGYGNTAPAIICQTAFRIVSVKDLVVVPSLIPLGDPELFPELPSLIGTSEKTFNAFPSVPHPRGLVFLLQVSAVGRISLIGGGDFFQKGRQTARNRWAHRGKHREESREEREKERGRAAPESRLGRYQERGSPREQGVVQERLSAAKSWTRFCGACFCSPRSRCSFRCCRCDTISSCACSAS